jgi:serine/threonine protein phosphatase PrpC
MTYTPALPVDTFTHRGSRAYQHDRLAHGTRALSAAHPPAFAAAVFDGHGQPDTGHLVADLCSRTFLDVLFASPHWADSDVAPPLAKRVHAALADAVASVELASEVLSSAERTYAGTTLCAVVVLSGVAGPTAVLSANVGDSRAVLALGDWDAQLSASPLTSDHVPTRSDELARINAAGGWVTNRLLNGYIGMSRAIGDIDLKAHRNITAFPPPPADASHPALRVGDFADTLLVATPEIVLTEVSDDAHFVIVASDGVWHVLSSQDAVSVVAKSLRAGKTRRGAAKTLVKHALASGAQDNITVVVVALSHQAAFVPLGRRQNGYRATAGLNLSSRSTLSSANDGDTGDGDEDALADRDDLDKTSSRSTIDLLNRIPIKSPPRGRVRRIRSAFPWGRNESDMRAAHVNVPLSSVPSAAVGGVLDLEDGTASCMQTRRNRDDELNSQTAIDENRVGFFKGLVTSHRNCSHAKAAAKQRRADSRIYRDDDETVHGAHLYPCDASSRDDDESVHGNHAYPAAAAAVVKDSNPQSEKY